MSNVIKKPMTRTEMISEIANEINCEKNLVKNIITCYEKVLVEDLLKSHETKIGSIGKIKIKERKERTGINPSSGEKVTIPAKIAPKFTFSKSLKEEISTNIKKI